MLKLEGKAAADVIRQFADEVERGEVSDVCLFPFCVPEYGEGGVLTDQRFVGCATVILRGAANLSSLYQKLHHDLCRNEFTAQVEFGWRESNEARSPKVD